MDKLDFDKIYRETLAEVEPVLFRKIQLFSQDILNKPYPDLIPKDQIIGIVEDYVLFTVRTILSESVRATSLMLQRYHDKE
ncbi:hypothetical protein JCM15765_02360 [Paradesulfitobacterium aromaticivorans]